MLLLAVLLIAELIILLGVEDMVEYGVILAVIAILVFAALTLVQPHIVNTLNKCCDSL